MSTAALSIFLLRRRNMKIDGVAVPVDELLNLDKYELPTHGNLVLDYAQLVFKKSSFPPVGPSYTFPNPPILQPLSSPHSTASPYP